MLRKVSQALDHYRQDFPKVDTLNQSLLSVSKSKDEDFEKEYVEEDCITLLQEYCNNFITYKEQLYKIYRNSGKDYNDYGRFEECE